MRPDLRLLESALGHSFQDRELLIRALTHKSIASDHKPVVEAVSPSADEAVDNEQLEFLGDAILGFVVSECLIQRYPSYSEGRLSKVKAHLVSAVRLFEVAKGLRLGHFLKLGRGEEMSGGREKRALLANALEAVIAAIYLDGGLEPARSLIVRIIVGDAEGRDAGGQEIVDYKSALQERTQVLNLPQPRYVIAGESGPEHAKTFVVEARVPPSWNGRGKGPRRRLRGSWRLRLCWISWCESLCRTS